MAAEIEPQSYSNVTAFLATAGIVVPLFKRLRISPVLGFLGAGVALGPYGLGRFVEAVPVLDYVTVTRLSDAHELYKVIEAAQAGLLEDKRAETDTLLNERREVLP